MVMTNMCGASMNDMPTILRLEEIRKEDISSVGGKGASLGEMYSIGLPVPNGYVVTAQAFRRFLVETGIEEPLFRILDDLDVEDTDALDTAARKAQEMVRATGVPDAIRDEVFRAYRDMGDDAVVAVRSSATAEDLPDASFAGQQDTFLNIRGNDNLLNAVRNCWASLYGARALYYRARQGFDDRTVNIAVVVQELVYAEKAGVLFTSHPVTGEPFTIVEASWGLGEAVVSGTVSPDNYVFDHVMEKVVDRTIPRKELMIVPVQDGGTSLVPVEEERQAVPVLSDEEVARLAVLGEIAEQHYGIPQDIEWAIVGSDIYILQSRPITTLGTSGAGISSDAAAGGRILIEGQGASPGVASGKVAIVRNIKDSGLVQEGEILVAKMTNPDMVPAMRRVAGIVTDEGGLTCHAAIVSRELGTPAVVGTKTATKMLKPGQIITIDGEKGLVYEGEVTGLTSAQEEAAGVAGASAPALVTATSIKVNVSLPEAAARAAATGADGVGLLRIEHLILGLGRTPGWFIRHGKEEEFIGELFNGIRVVLDAFPGKPVWVRTLDAPTDEFRNMQGGEDEPEEHNPMLGWRGIRRDLQSPDQFRMQVEAFRRLWDAGYGNLGLMFPLVSHPDEFLRAKAMMKDWGIDVDRITLGIMVEIPSSALLIEDFIKAGIQFASFGTNDLIQYTLAIDRNNEHVADMYAPTHPAVLRLIDYTIQCCRRHGVESSICGQAGSDPEMVEWLVRHGISGVSANIDAVVKMRQAAARTEQAMLLDHARSSDNETDRLF